MSTAENAADPNNAASTEMSSLMSSDPHESPKNVARGSDKVGTNGPGASIHPARLDSRKPPPQPSESTLTEHEARHSISSTNQEIEDEGSVWRTTAKMKDLSSAISSGVPTTRPPVKDLPRTPPPPPEKDLAYLDPTPKTPQTSRPVSRQASDDGEYSEKDPQYLQDPGENELSAEQLQQDSEGMADKGSESEIQSIMEQFTGESKAGGEKEEAEEEEEEDEEEEEELMSPPRDMPNPM